MIGTKAHIFCKSIHFCSTCQRNQKSLEWSCGFYANLYQDIVFNLKYILGKQITWLSVGYLPGSLFDLMKPYVNKNHRLYFNNFYTSPKLVEDLQISGIYSCGTIRTVKGQFPEDFKRAKLEISSSLFLQADNERRNMVVNSLHEKLDKKSLNSS